MKATILIMLLALVAGGASECDGGGESDVDSDMDSDGDGDSDADSDTDTDSDGDDECQHTCHNGYPGGCPDDLWKCETGKCDKIGDLFFHCCGPYGC